MTCVYLRGNLRSVWPPNASLYASSTCVHLRILAGPFAQGLIFHSDLTVEGREGMEQIMPQATDDDRDSHVPSITLVDDSTIEIVAVGEVSDQGDEYDTDSGSDIDDDDHDY